MLHPVASCISPGPGAPGAYYKHIVYLGIDGHLHDLIAPLTPVAGGFAPEGVWKYNFDITAAANAMVNATNAIHPNYLSAVPNAVGHVWAMTTVVGSVNVLHIYYWGADQQIHVLFPVGYGFLFPGEPGTPGDPGDFLDGGGTDPGFPSPTPPSDPLSVPLGFEVDLGDPNGLASPAGWLDHLITDPTATGSYESGPPLAVYTGEFGEATVIFFSEDGSGLYAVQGDTNGWSNPVNISNRAGNPNIGSDACAMRWNEDDSDHVFSIDDLDGLLKELWSQNLGGALLGDTTWGAHDVLHQVKTVTGSSPHSPLAPRALVGSVPAAFDSSGLIGGGAPGSKNVAYITTNGTGVYLCSHAFKGEWTISYISEIAQAPPAGSGSAPFSGATNLLAYVSDRPHVLLTGGDGQIVDLWNDGSTWHWGLPIRIAGNPLGAGQLANVATGMSAFVTPDNVDHIVYLEGEPTSADLGPFIWELQYVQSQPQVPDNPSDPNFPQKGLPWVAVNVSMQVAGPIQAISWSNPNYVPPINTAEKTH